MRFPKTNPVFALMLASFMVLFLFPAGAAGHIDGLHDHWVGFNGEVLSGSWWTDPLTPDEGLSFHFDIADGRLVDTDLPETKPKGKGDPGQIVSFSGWNFTDNPCEFWFMRGAERFDDPGSFPYDDDSGKLNAVSLTVGGEHVVRQPDDAGGCTGEKVTDDHFFGTVEIAVALVPAEKCPKKGPKGGCVRSNSLEGSFTVTTTSGNVFDGEWLSESFGWTGWSSRNYKTTWWWFEVIPPE
jgi:hypothetical protein